MELKIDTLQDAFYKKNQISTPGYDIEEVRSRTKEAPIWVHFGIGNIFRIFIGGLQETLLDKGLSDRGIVCVETFDHDIVEKIYRPYDNLALGITLKADGSTERRVIGSLAEAISAKSGDTPEWDRLKTIFEAPSLQMLSFTVTEKGYALKGSDGAYLPYILPDLDKGPDNPSSAMAVATSLLFHRFSKGGHPVAVVSMDNCSHNGEKLQNAIFTMASEWEKRGLVGADFSAWLTDESKVSFPWSMIDKITPRPDGRIADQLESIGLQDMQPIITDKKTFIAPFVNAEGPQYLVVEDSFPNGRPPLEKAGVYFTDRKTVNDVERMKVTTCLNPLHTALAVYGCLLGYTSIAEEMKDEDLKTLVEGIGPKEGMEVVCDPGILSPEKFVTEVLTERLPNAFIPDTPQRIATDTSQKVGIRYGETIKSYVEKYGSAKRLHFIPIAIAGWMRYLLGVDDEGKTYELSPDPMVEELTGILSKVHLGDGPEAASELYPILSNANIFGSDLYEAGIGKRIEELFAAEISGTGAVRRTLQNELHKKK
ncbi:MAG: mannitol dehydrogenase family protein [Lachnospiraceae bacterium]|nr:mannitol dehydrogenase family protein [Lachnospiraceae bacterium]